MMKRYFYLLLLSFVLVSCQSKEEKAAELIKNELSKTLYDFESYSPIETIVTEAKLSVYTDTVCWQKANLLLYSFELASNALDEAKDAEEYMEIWGPPTSYSSSSSDRKYYKYRDEYKEKVKEATKYWKIVETLSSELKDTLKTLDENAIIGWEVKHRFRCKTKGGNSTIGDYRYVLDKNLKKVLICEDTDDDKYKQIREIIKLAQNGDINK